LNWFFAVGKAEKVKFTLKGPWNCEKLALIVDSFLHRGFQAMNLPWDDWDMGLVKTSKVVKQRQHHKCNSGFPQTW